MHRLVSGFSLPAPEGKSAQIRGNGNLDSSGSGGSEGKGSDHFETGADLNATDVSLYDRVLYCHCRSRRKGARGSLWPHHVDIRTMNLALLRPKLVAEGAMQSEVRMLRHRRIQREQKISQCGEEEGRK